jgi:serine/threonine-protein kinase
MPIQATCPEPRQFQALLEGALHPADLDRVTEHLETCLDCQRALEGLEAERATCSDALRRLGQQGLTPEPALLRAMDALQAEPVKAETQTEPITQDELSLDFLSAPDRPEQLGRLDHYEVLEVIGRGGMGVILKAFDPSLNRFVAIKVLARQLATSAAARKRFAREGRAAAAVHHEHVVAIYAVAETRGLPYLVMEYVHGVSLQQRLDRDGPLALKEILRIGMQTARGLAAAHAHGLIHRDIKPANILLEDGTGRVKITDFGLARAVDDGSLTQSGVVAGTPQYMAPEQARAGALDTRADLFSLGSVLYALCTDRPPFQANATMAVLRSVCDDTPAPIRASRPEIPDWLCAVIDRLHAKNADDRFQSAAEVAELLAQYLAHVEQPEVVPLPPRTPILRRAAGQPRRSRTIGAAVLVAGFALAAYLLGPALFRIATDQGEFEVQTDDPNIAVLIEKGGGIKVHDRTANREYLLKVGKQNVRAGTYELDVAELPAGVAFQTTTFQLQRGGTVVATARAVAGASGAPPSQLEYPFKPQAQPGDVNLVFNPGFEETADPEGKQLTYWIALPKTTPFEPEAQCYRDTTTRFKGQASAAIIKPEVNIAEAEAGFMQNLPKLPGGEQVYITAYIKTKDLVGHAQARLQFVNQQGMDLGFSVAGNVSGTTDWKRVQATAAVPMGAMGELSLVVKGKGSAWFDEVYVFTAKGSRFAPLQSAAPAQPGKDVPAGTDLLKNGGFDDLINNLPRSWLPVGQGVPGLTFRADRDVKHGGTAAASIWNTGKDAQQPYNWRQDILENIPAGKPVTFTGWVKTKDATLVSVAVQLFDAQDRMLAFHTTQNKQDFQGTADWKPFTLRFLVPRSTTHIGVLAMLMRTGEVWFDDFAMVVEDPRK